MRIGAGLSSGLSSTARTLTAGNQETAAQAARVSAAADDPSGNVQTVAAGSEEMGQSHPGDRARRRRGRAAVARFQV